MSIKKYFRASLAALLVLAVIGIGPASLPAKAAGQEFYEYNGNRYMVLDKSFDWDTARRYCEGLGGHLVTVGDAGEQQFVESLLSKGDMGAYWLGLCSDGKVWRWVDEEPVSYTHWNTDQPDNYFGDEYYGMIYARSAQYNNWSVTKGCWNDIALDADTGDNEGAVRLSDMGFICEWEKGSNGAAQTGETGTRFSDEVIAILDSMTLEEKAAQMVQPAVYCVSEQEMKWHCYGSILSKTESLTYTQWQTVVDGYQTAALESSAGIPYIYGQDDVHGVNYCSGAVIFPHNIGIGAANNNNLAYRVGKATANEAMLCHMIWNFSPCVAVSVDPRWGRTYESYGADTKRVAALSRAYTMGLIDGGVIACAKHFFADGNVLYGTGENSDDVRIMDRGDARLSDGEIAPLLDIYQQLIDTGVQTIMISHSSLNGVKMHENAQYIQYLKNDMGFTGFLVSDWNSVQNTSAATYEEQVITCVNAGIDMLMEVEDFETARQIIVRGVKSGRIEESRVDDAVGRILQVKQNAGVLDDPYFKNYSGPQQSTGSAEYRALAEEAVEKSLVLVKNDDQTLPFSRGTKIYVTGPAMDSGRAQCGGWTIDWNESPEEDVPGCTTILEGLKSRQCDFGIEIITDPKKADTADVVLVVLGEQAYAEWYGDTEDLSIYGDHALPGNKSAFQSALALGKPVVTCIVAGRQVLLEDVYDRSDSVVMCYLPGSEGRGVADVLCGDTNFSGTLPSPWYASLDQIGSTESWLDIGYGLRY